MSSLPWVLILQRADFDLGEKRLVAHSFLQEEKHHWPIQAISDVNVQNKSASIWSITKHEQYNASSLVYR